MITELGGVRTGSWHLSGDTFPKWPLSVGLPSLWTHQDLQTSPPFLRVHAGLLDQTEINWHFSKFSKQLRTPQLFLQPGAFSCLSDSSSLPLLSRLLTELGLSLCGPWSPCPHQSPASTPSAGSCYALAPHIPAPASGGRQTPPDAQCHLPRCDHELMGLLF